MPYKSLPSLFSGGVLQSFCPVLLPWCWGWLQGSSSSALCVLCSRLCSAPSPVPALLRAHSCPENKQNPIQPWSVRQFLGDFQQRESWRGFKSLGSGTRFEKHSSPGRAQVLSQPHSFGQWGQDFIFPLGMAHCMKYSSSPRACFKSLLPSTAPLFIPPASLAKLRLS